MAQQTTGESKTGRRFRAGQGSSVPDLRGPAHAAGLTEPAPRPARRTSSPATRTVAAGGRPPRPPAKDGHLPFPQTKPLYRLTGAHHGRARRPGGRAHAGGGSFRFPEANFRDARGIVMLEFVVALVIIGLRAIADYRPASDQSQPGSEKPLKGLGPLPLTAATCFSWFILSSVAQKKGYTSYFAASFGALMLLVLLMNSSGELASVATWIDDLGGWSPAAPQAQTATPVESAPGTGQTTTPPATPEQNNPPGWKAVPGTFGAEVYPVGGKCPSGWSLNPDKTRCIAPLATTTPLT